MLGGWDQWCISSLRLVDIPLDLFGSFQLEVVGAARKSFLFWMVQTWAHHRPIQWFKKWNVGQTHVGWWFETFFCFPYIGNSNSNWLSYFSEGWLNHQPACWLGLWNSEGFCETRLDEIQRIPGHPSCMSLPFIDRAYVYVHIYNIVIIIIILLYMHIYSIYTVHIQHARGTLLFFA